MSQVNEQFPRGLITPYNSFSKGYSVMKLFKKYLTPLHITYADDCCVEDADITPVRANNGSIEAYNVTTKQWDIISGGGGGIYSPNGITLHTAGGLTAGTDLGTSPVSIQDLLDTILYAYLSPSISLVSSVAGGIFEFGDVISSMILQATTVKNSDDITTVTYHRNGALIHTEASPSPIGGFETFTVSVPVTTDTTFTAKVDDGNGLITSNSIDYGFVYPFYYGVGAVGLSGVNIAALTKLVQVQSDITTTTSPTGQVFYFAYPSAYPTLTSILDTNGFETIADYTIRTVSITGLDATSQSYRVYEYNNITTQTSFNNTYIF